MESMKLMDVGYNLIEAKLIGKEFEEIKEKISIIEFLRRLQRKQMISQKISVSGLGNVLLAGEETLRFIRKVLTSSTNMLRTHIIQFPIRGELTLNREPKMRYRTREISLTPIFGNRIKLKTIGYFHSPPNI